MTQKVYVLIPFRLLWLPSAAICEGCCLHFLTLGRMLTPWSTLGTMGAAGRTHGVWNPILNDFVMILGPHVASLLDTEG